MNSHIFSINIDDKPFKIEVYGDFYWGNEQHCLYKSLNNIIGKTSWEDKGYTIMKNIVTFNQFNSLRSSITSTLIRITESLGISINKNLFFLEDYHLFIKSDEEHQAIIEKSRELSIDDFEFDIETITDNLSGFMNFRLTSWIKELNKSHIQLRINRPKTYDINPPHRDGYIDGFKDVLNIWLPISGCNEETSLPVIPRSHFLPENKIFKTDVGGATINKNLYNVPCILKTNHGELKMIRPNPKETEALVFTPYLIHGAAFNESNNTRVALELRFPRL